jgi:hypothetical protein
LKVIQCPAETGGQMDLFIKGLKNLGYDVSAYQAEDLQRLLNVANQTADIFHFHNGLYFSEQLAGPEFEKLDHAKKLIHYWGKDLRTEEIAVIHNPYIRLGYDFENEKIKQSLDIISKKFPACIVQDYELQAYASMVHDRVYVLPLAVDLQEIDNLAPSASTHRSEPLIIHAPMEGKGTEYVEEGLERLRNEGYSFSYERVEGLSRNEALQRYRQADLIIDNLLRGSYGLVAIEGMALGKPVISYVREDLKHRYPSDLPIISANPANLYDALTTLLQNPTLREEKGRAGRQYVEREHALPVVARQLDRIYQSEGVTIPNPNPNKPKTISLQPNRFFTRQGKKRSASFFSFNLAQIPSSMSIVNAVIHLPVTAGKRKKVAVFRIKTGWSRKRIPNKRPILSSKPIKRLIAPRGKKKVVRSIVAWECTLLTRRWRNDQLRNHGVYISKKLWGRPSLILTLAD